MPLHGPIGVVDDLSVLRPGQPADVVRIIQTVEEVKNELLAVSAADEVHLGTLQLDERRIEAHEDSAEGQLHFRIGRTDLTGQDFGVGVAGRAEEAQSDESWPAALDLFNDRVVGRVGVGLVEHHAFMARALQHGRERHDADRGKPHHSDMSVFSPGLGRKGVKLRVTDVNQEDEHYGCRISFRQTFA